MQTQGREMSHEDADTPTQAEACEVETGLALCYHKASVYGYWILGVPREGISRDFVGRMLW